MRTLKGIYVLIIKVDQDIKVTVGALGEKIFQKGVYAYVGSAQKNLEQRVKRHLRKDKTKFWHIDYLLQNKNAKIIQIFHKQAHKIEECHVAIQISKQGLTVKNFGCSDCYCKSHLFQITNIDFLHESMTTLEFEDN